MLIETNNANLFFYHQLILRLNNQGKPPVYVTSKINKCDTVVVLCY